MTLCAAGAPTGQKRLNMVAILKFKMAAEDTLEKMETTQVLFLGVFTVGYLKGKKHWLN